MPLEEALCESTSEVPSALLDLSMGPSITVQVRSTPVGLRTWIFEYLTIPKKFKYSKSSFFLKVRIDIPINITAQVKLYSRLSFTPYKTTTIEAIVFFEFPSLQSTESSNMQTDELTYIQVRKHKRKVIMLCV